MTEGEQSHLLDLMMALRNRREAYALATVVETKGSASASPGSKALIGRDGTLLAGWVGGGCAEATVRQAALGDHISAVRALRSPAGYVAVIASRKRSRLVSDFLRGEGFAEEELARLRAPAGLDLGARTPEEIALSVIGEIVMLRRGGSGRPRRDAAAHRTGPRREETAGRELVA